LRGYLSTPLFLFPLSLEGLPSSPLFLFSLSLEGRGHRGEGEKGEVFLTATPTLILPPQGGGDCWRKFSLQGGGDCWRKFSLQGGGDYWREFSPQGVIFPRLSSFFPSPLRGYLSLPLFLFPLFLEGLPSSPLFLFSLSLEGRGHMGEGEKGEEFLTATPTLILPPKGGGDCWRKFSLQGGKMIGENPHLKEKEL
jgi:hypothetical protein